MSDIPQKNQPVPSAVADYFRASPANYEFLLNNLGEAVVSLDPDRRIVTWNKAAERMYGWKAEEVKGRRIMDVISMTYPPGWDAQSMHRALVEKGTWEGDITQTTKDGRILSVHTIRSLMRDEDGNIVGMNGINVDVTEQKKVEAAESAVFCV